jgi:hypothetical protein
MARTHRLRNVRRLARWISSAVSRLRNGPDYSSWQTTGAEVYSSKSGYFHEQIGAEI